MDNERCGIADCRKSKDDGPVTAHGPYTARHSAVGVLAPLFGRVRQRPARSSRSAPEHYDGRLRRTAAASRLWKQLLAHEIDEDA